MVVRPKCDSEDYVRDGIVKGQQRHRCKGCGYRAYRVTLRKSPEVKPQALALYLEGLSSG